MLQKAAALPYLQFHEYLSSLYERFNDKERGKGFAMEWMFARLFEMKRKYDAVAIFDADNLVLEAQYIGKEGAHFTGS